MTEDDTFRILSRFPLEQVKREALKEFVNLDTLEEAEEFLKPYGWTVEELATELGIWPLDEK